MPKKKLIKVAKPKTADIVADLLYHVDKLTERVHQLELVQKEVQVPQVTKKVSPQ